MNKVIYSLCVLTAAIAFSSCNKEEPNLFKESASARMETRVANYRQLLVKPENGWLMEYYPGGSNRNYGGFALCVKFEQNGNCVFQSILSDDLSKQALSQYTIKKDFGPTLNFDTYNDLFHYFSSPDISDGEGEGNGLNGDYEFILGQIDGDSFTMIGKKHGSIIRMSPLDIPATEYLQKVKKEQDSFVYIPGLQGVVGTLGGKDITGSFINTKYLELEQDNQLVKLSYMFTDKGIKLYSEYELNGNKIKDLIWDAQNQTLKSSDNVLDLRLKTADGAMLMKDLLGNYELQYYGGKTDVVLSRVNDKVVVMTGLPFNVYFTYSFPLGRLELSGQKVLNNPNVQLAIWSLPAGSLRWGKGVGMYLKPSGDNENLILSFEDNSEDWLDADGSLLKANAFILWDTDAHKVYNGFGRGRFSNLKLVRK